MEDSLEVSLVLREALGALSPPAELELSRIPTIPPRMVCCLTSERLEIV